MAANREKILILEKQAKQIRRLIIDISYHANKGHIASALSIADILTVLYHDILRQSKSEGKNRFDDRFILSKGHAAAALYACLYSKKLITKKQLYSFCQENGQFGTHPDYNPGIGIECTTGSLGHGLAIGTGLALGLKHKKDVKIYVLCSDAELNEGSIWESIMFASQHKLDNLVLIIDENSFQAFGKTEEIINLKPLTTKFKAFGWISKVINGNSITELVKTFHSLPFSPDHPSVIIAQTTAGKGVSFIEKKLEWHYFPLNENQYHQALKELS